MRKPMRICVCIYCTVQYIKHRLDFVRGRSDTMEMPDLKCTVSRDFRPSVFFISVITHGPRFDFAEIFANMCGLRAMPHSAELTPHCATKRRVDQKIFTRISRKQCTMQQSAESICHS
jgi:hypothetical protein